MVKKISEKDGSGEKKKNKKTRKLIIKNDWL